MSRSVEVVEATLRCLDDLRADVLVLPIFSDERPLTGLAGLVDWRLRGALSQWLVSGFATGAERERVLYPSRGRVTFPVVLVVGLGPRAQHRSDRAASAAADAAATAVGLGARSLVGGLFGLERLPSPLERSVPPLIAALTAPAELETVTLAVGPEHIDVIKEARTSGRG